MRRGGRGWPSMATAFAIGFVEFGIFFSDGADPTGRSPRLQIAIALCVASGFLLAYFRPERWLFLALLSSWGAILLGAMGVAMGQERAISIALAPATAALLAGAAARWLGGQARRNGSLVS